MADRIGRIYYFIFRLERPVSTKTLHFLNALMRAFEQGRLLALAHHFTFPMPAYVHDGLLVFGSPETLVEALEEYRDIVSAKNITRLVPRIIAEGITVNGQSNLWVEIDHLDQDDVCQRTSQARFVLHYPWGSVSPKIEMVDYTVAAFPELADRLPLALPA